MPPRGDIVTHCNIGSYVLVPGFVDVPERGQSIVIGLRICSAEANGAGRTLSSSGLPGCHVGQVWWIRTQSRSHDALRQTHRIETDLQACSTTSPVFLLSSRRPVVRGRGAVRERSPPCAGRTRLTDRHHLHHPSRENFYRAAVAGDSRSLSANNSDSLDRAGSTIARPARQLQSSLGSQGVRETGRGRPSRIY